MSSRYFLTSDLVCNSGFAEAISTISPIGEDRMAISTRHGTSSSFLIRVAMRMSRSRCFSFLRRVFHYQNGLRSEQGSNPFNSTFWMSAELIVLIVQITMITSTLASSKKERPIWPMRIWVVGYGFGCLLSLIQLFWRYFVFVLPRVDASSLPDVEQQRDLNESRYTESLNKYRAFLELFFAIWFVMGNVWVFDSRFGSFHRAPKLHVLCIVILSWNAISYSFPFILFVLLCCVVPMFSTFVGYNMNMGSMDRGALEEQLSKLPSWKYKEVDNDTKVADSLPNNENQECCICLAKYKDKEEIRKLPCSHLFHLKCIDQWLRIISCCPLCKQELQR